jgi:hypothetical protein
MSWDKEVFQSTAFAIPEFFKRVGNEFFVGLN